MGLVAAVCGEFNIHKTLPPRMSVILPLVSVSLNALIPTFFPHSSNCEAHQSTTSA